MESGSNQEINSTAVIDEALKIILQIKITGNVHEILSDNMQYNSVKFKLQAYIYFFKPLICYEIIIQDISPNKFHEPFRTIVVVQRYEYQL